MKKYIVKFYDFVKAWMYYPKMKKYLEKLGVEVGQSRLQYAIWHCKTGMLRLENVSVGINEVREMWKSIYQITPIEK